MSDPTNTASYESKSEAVDTLEDFVRVWCDQINRSTDEEKPWCDQAEEAEKAYKGDEDSRTNDFNIFHANIETLVPALYNSTPVPDIRRRFLDADPVGKQVSQLLERALSFSVDNYDFDSIMFDATKDMCVGGRGVVRVRYQPYFKGTMEDPENPDEQIDKLAYQEVTCEHVSRQDYRRGPGRFRAEMPWEAFRLYLSKDEVAKLIEGSKIKIEEVPFTYTASSSGNDPKQTDNPKGDVFKRALVWEIWDKESREVIFICPGYAKGPLKREKDPLELEGFFCTPRPMQALIVPGSMTPVAPYSIYKKLVDELNEITRRIRLLVKACRARGGYASATQDIKAIAEADEAELVPLQGVDALAMGAGLEKAILWWPIEQIAKALETLYAQREIIKQTIYEVTGIADILRGATDARETLGAQQLKAQWGSLRIQRMQGEVARFARDLFRLKSEIIANKFQPQVLQMMTGVQITPEVMALLHDDVARSYRIDIESDSTIRADMMRNQEAMTAFLQGTAQYLAAVGPAVQEGYMPPDAAVAVYTAFARQFKLGKQAEDALDKLQEGATQAAQQPKADPEAEKMKAELELRAQEVQANIQAKQAELQLKTQESQAKLQLEQQAMAHEQGLAEQKLQGELAIKQQSAKENASIKRASAMAKPQPTGGGKGKDGKSSGPSNVSVDMSGFADAVEENGALMAQAVQILAQSSDRMASAAEAMARATNAPKRIVLDEQGEPVGIEPVSVQ